MKRGMPMGMYKINYVIYMYICIHIYINNDAETEKS